MDGVGNEDVYLVLQHYDLDVERSIQAFLKGAYKKKRMCIAMDHLEASF